MTLLLAVFFLSGLSWAAQESKQWKADEIITPEQLVKILSSKSEKKPLVVQVGFDFLYHGGHISGAIFAGPASQPQGINRLKEAVKDIRKDREIILYCGCCPWAECPNIKPAFETMKKLGFKNIKMLYIPINFEHDWISKGYPVVKGDEP